MKEWWCRLLGVVTSEWVLSRKPFLAWGGAALWVGLYLSVSAVVHNDNDAEVFSPVCMHIDSAIRRRCHLYITWMSHGCFLHDVGRV